MLTDLLLVAAGVGLLYAGGEILVTNASAMARRLGLSPLVIGLTVVAFGTSSPELATTMIANLQGAPGVAFGNVVGSNIANIGLVLGVAALLCPMTTHAAFLRREIPFMLFSSAGLFAVVLGGRVARWEGLVMIALLGAYLWYLLHQDRERPDVEKEFDDSVAGGDRPLWRSSLGVLVGLAVLAAGAKLMVYGAVNMATDLGVSERVVGLTVVAFGTSLPELAATIVAARRHWADLILGSLIGSNIFNVLFILGSTAVVSPLELDMTAIWIDLGVMFLFSLAIWPFLKSGMRIERSEGAILICGYVTYVVWLFVR